MYLISFIKVLFKPKNLMPAIYFFINLAIIFMVFYIMPFKIIDNAIWNPIIIGFIGIGINTLVTLVTLSPIGELFWRISNNIKKQPIMQFNEAWQIANYVFEEVKTNAINRDKHIPEKVKLYYSPSDDINSFALGRRTIIITQGILTIDPEYLKGVLAHEFGHISNNDSVLNLGINVANGFITIIVTLVSAIAFLVSSIFTSISDENNSCICGIIGIVNYLLYIILVGLFKLWSMLGVLCINKSSRKHEYLADQYAAQLGYGENLALFLKAMDVNTVKTSKFSLMFQTHPNTLDRLQALGYT